MATYIAQNLIRETKLNTNIDILQQTRVQENCGKHTSQVKLIIKMNRAIHSWNELERGKGKNTWPKIALG